MALLETGQEEAYEKYNLVMDIIAPECGKCTIAHSVALDLLTDLENGSLNASDAEREYALRIGGHCRGGLIELSSRTVCPAEDVIARRSTYMF